MPRSSMPRRPSAASRGGRGRGPVVSVSAIEDLAAALPHLLGFRPAESLVLVALTGPRDELTFTLRLDLPDQVDLAEVVAMCAARMAVAEADEVIAFVVTEATDPVAGQLPESDLVEALQRALAMPLRDAFLLRAGRVWSYLCPDAGCCPADGRPVDEASAVATTLAAAGVVAGRPLFRDRDEIVLAAQAVDGAEAEAMVEAIRHVSAERVDVVRRRYRAALPQLLARCAERGPELSHDEAALLGWVWHQFDLRDDVLTAVARDVPGADALVRAVARLVPPPYDAPAAAMLGWVAYAEGSGVLAAAALARASATDPAYSLARLLDDALYRQVPPSALRTVWARFADDEPRRDRSPRRGPTPAARPEEGDPCWKRS